MTRQSTENNLTNIASIAIKGPVGFIQSENLNSYIPLSEGLDNINAVTIRMRDYNNKPITFSTPTFFNIKVNFFKKTL